MLLAVAVTGDARIIAASFDFLVLGAQVGEKG